MSHTQCWMSVWDEAAEGSWLRAFADASQHSLPVSTAVIVTELRTALRAWENIDCHLLYELVSLFTLIAYYFRDKWHYNETE